MAERVATPEARHCPCRASGENVHGQAYACTQTSDIMTEKSAAVAAGSGFLDSALRHHYPKTQWEWGSSNGRYDCPDSDERVEVDLKS